MAQLVVAKGYTPPDRLAVHLREGLPESYHVVVGPRIRQQAFDAIVIAENGVVVMYFELRGGGYDSPKLSLLEGEDPKPSFESISAEKRQVFTDALHAFMHDEFPSLHVSVEHLGVVDNSRETLHDGLDTRPPQVPLTEASQAILAIDWPMDAEHLSPPQQKELACALVERGLTLTERATAPFTFRSGGRFRQRCEVWTLLDAIRHLDQSPDDGVYHLSNGTLVRWFEDQGAHHMARYGREALRESTGDERAVLETFLQRTDVVSRPRFRITPRIVDLGDVRTGDAAKSSLRVEKASGRGYLFGSITSQRPWLRTEPSRLSNGAYDGVVIVDTTQLPIRSEPYEANLQLTLGAADAPIEIPVRFRIASHAFLRQRRISYVAACALLTGLMGATIGGLLAMFGEPSLLERTAAVAPVAKGSWSAAGVMASVAAMWALSGTLYALGESGAPTSGLRSWFAKLSTWAAGLFLGGCGALLAVGYARPFGTAREAATLGLLLSSLAVVPALLVTVRSRQAQTGRPPSTGTKQNLIERRSIYLTFGGALALSAFLVMIRWPPHALDVTQAGSWLSEGVGGIEQRVNNWTDELLIHYYDRRVPSMPTLVPTSTPGPAGDTDEPVEILPLGN